MCVCVQVDTVDKIQLEVERNPHTKPAHGHTFSVSVAPRTPFFERKEAMKHMVAAVCKILSCHILQTVPERLA